MASADVVVAFSPGPGQVTLAQVKWSAGLTVAQAIDRSGIRQLHPEMGDQVVLGVWSRAVQAETVLRAGDRVEICRPLRVDPKEARRQRYRAQSPKHKPPQVRRPRPAVASSFADKDRDSEGDPDLSTRTVKVGNPMP